MPPYEGAVLRKVGEWIASHGDLLYVGRPVDCRCAGLDFVLEKDGAYYYFAHDLSRRGSSHVVTKGGGNGPRVVDQFPVAIKSVRWMDDGEAGRFTQSTDSLLLTLDCQGYAYGYDRVVRVAELTAA